MKRNFYRNQEMVNLEHVPDSIRINITNQYYKQTPQRGKLMEYFTKKNLKNLMEHIGDF